MPSKVLIVSAEPSSNLYAERLMEETRSRSLDIDFWGVGNEKMETYGLTRVGKAEEMAVMGLQEVIKHYSFIKKIFNQILEQVDASTTRVAILMDYAEFNMKLAEELRKRGVKVVFYIAPQVWAWRRGRVKKIKRDVDELLSIFPFETTFYEEHGVSTNFVGHPLLDELTDDINSEEKRQVARAKLGIAGHAKVLALMPGSRKSELSLNFRTQIDTAKKVKALHPDTVIIVLTAPGMDKDLIKHYLTYNDPELLIVQDEPFKMLQLVDFAIVASGTATLVTGLMKVPMVVMYKMKPLTALIAKKLVSKNNPFFAMINLIFERELMPERFQEQANPEELSNLVEQYWFHEETYKKQIESLELLPSLLGSRGATSRVVDRLETFL